MKNHLESARRLTKLLDTNFSIFGIKFGFDAIIGLIPGIGDIIGLGLSTYIIWIAYRMNLPTSKIIAMAANSVFDALIGSIPIAGNIVDFIFRANSRNLKIIEDYYNSRPTGTEQKEYIEGSII